MLEFDAHPRLADQVRHLAFDGLQRLLAAAQHGDRGEGDEAEESQGGQRDADGTVQKSLNHGAEDRSRDRARYREQSTAQCTGICQYALSDIEISYWLKIIHRLPIGMKGESLRL
ncbi:hypothetical protein GCM10009530_11160 [Microbispora corallina]|uniref:Uncharacterized protein n=1 Tax=Microbispora corallina TaxID=83302 RepID=A0ABQ4FTM9_9ACTN|nr:hypothetical protein Mco01_11870 [Microbispora corallina]